MSAAGLRDEAARASDPAASAWVSANAGAGKTHLLANRVTRLLLDGVKPERILCLTYTKAAAAEMSRRLFDRLGAWALLSEKELAAELVAIGAGHRAQSDLNRARTLFAQALETPGGLKIQTLHSFCQHVLTRFPVEAGISPRFQVLEERTAAELMRRAQNEILERAAAGEEPLARAVSVLATRVDDKSFGETINLAVGQTRGRLRSVLGKHGNDEALFSRRLRTQLGVPDGLDDVGVVAEFCEKLRTERAQCERVQTWLRAGAKSDQASGQCLLNFLSGGMTADVFGDFAQLFLTKDGEPRQRLVTQKLAASQPALATYLTDLAERFYAIHDRRKAALTATLTEAIVLVSMNVLAVYDRLKSARAALDYDDLIARTLALLDKKEAAQWVLYKLDGGLDHILVDEAQDTSPEQWSIVKTLVGEFFAGVGVRDDGKVRTVFAVGDEKQSIFSFQGAAPDEFARSLTHFRNRAEDARLPFEDVRPAVSRRSAKAILEFVDAVFTDPRAYDGLTAAGGPPRHEPHRSTTGRVELWPLTQRPAKVESNLRLGVAPVDAPNEKGADHALAALIARRVAEFLKSGLVLPKDKPEDERPLRPGDIMLLVRRRNSFAHELIRQLVAHGVAVAGADRMALAQQIAVADLIALGRFVLLPDDDLNMAALLKSPLLKFSEQDLYDLAYGRETPLWAALQARRNEKPIFQTAHGFLADCLARADFAAPFEFYARVLALGGRKAFAARLGSEAEDAIDEFLALAIAHEGVHAPSLQGFLDWFGRGADEIKRDMDEADAVRVMTVHGAKGLEADMVIVPDTTQIPNHEARAGILYTDDFVYYGVPKAMETTAVQAAKEAAHEREMREYRRLLYVALTRARERLIVCGYQTGQTGGMHPDSWYPLTAAAAKKKGHPETLLDGTEILVVGDANARPSKSGDAAATPLRAPIPNFLRMNAKAEPARPRILRPSEAAVEEFGQPEIVLSPFAGAGSNRFARGLHLHALLASLPAIAPAQREDQARRYGARNKLSARETEALTREALGVLSHPDFAPLFGPNSRGEVSIVAELPELGEGIRVSGQIDRLSVDARKVMVADFKTNRPAPRAEDDVPSLYCAQMALYRAALAKLYPQHRIVCALIWTEGPRLMTLSDVLLDAQLAQITSRFVG